MRFVVLCAALVALSANALADPFDDTVLRGSNVAPSKYQPPYEPGWPVFFRWSGFYAGGQVGRSSSGADFGNGTGSLVSYMLRNDVVLNHVQDWTTLPNDNSSRTSYGAFVGYNFQFDDVVLGMEANYNRTSTSMSAADGLSRAFADDTGAPSGHHLFYSATVSGNASARITDFGTLRARAGVVLGQFLPYVFGGAALGRVDITRSATVSYTRTDTPDATTPATTPLPTYNFGPQTRSDSQAGAFAYGYTVGLGIDVALLPNLFLRGEFEYIKFLSVKDIDLNVKTVRTGIAWKF